MAEGLLTCDEFVEIAKALLDDMGRNWAESRLRRPELYPERQEPLDWIEYFSVCYPVG